MKRYDNTGTPSGFSTWFHVMWSNWYIQLFAVGLAGTVAEIASADWVAGNVAEADGAVGTAMVWLGVCVFPAVMLIVAYKGFYQFWRDLRAGRSR